MTDELHIYLTGTQVFARRTVGPFWRRKIEHLGEWRWDSSNPATLNLDHLELTKKRRAKLHVYVGAALNKLMAVSMPTGLNDVHEQRVAAQAQMQNQFDLNAQEWCFSVDLIPAPAKSIVCGIRRILIERVQQLAAENNLILDSLKPFVVAVWEALLNIDHTSGQANQTLIAIEADAYTLLVERSGVMESAITLLHHNEKDLIEREMRRLAVSFGSVEQCNMRLAVDQSVLTLVRPPTDCLVSKSTYLNDSIYSDFRDLLFAPTEA